MTAEKSNQTLVFLKPDCTIRRGVSAKIIKSFIENNFKITAFKEINVSEELAKLHYKEHEGKFFYPWLVKMIQFFPVVAMIINETPDRIREVIGETFCHEAERNSLRGKYGIWGGVNSIHASDSLSSAERELELWRKFANLIPNQEETAKKINEYINKWDSAIEENLDEIRKVCESIKAFPKTIPDKIDEFRETLKKNLLPDLKKSKTGVKSIDKFLNIIIENCRL
jgi:nucleoside-diphosphate kinase